MLQKQQKEISGHLVSWPNCSQARGHYSVDGRGDDEEENVKNGQSDEAQKTCQHGVDSQRPCGQIHGPSAAPARCVSTVVVTGVNQTKDGNCVRTRAGRCISQARELTTVTRVNHLKTQTDLLMFSLGVLEPIHKSLSLVVVRKPRT